METPRKRNQSTIKTQRCTIQEYNAGDRKRWSVTWTANDEAKPVRIACASKHAAMTLADVLDAPGVLWPF